MCDYVITSRVFKGRLVRVSSNCMSVGDLIPRLIRFIRSAGSAKVSPPKSQRVAISGHFTALLISLVMTLGILALNIFRDGYTRTIYEPRNVYVWNGGKFVDTTNTTGLDNMASDVLGMASICSACVHIIKPGKIMLSAAGFFEKQDFRKEQSANKSICLNGVQTREKMGIKVSTNKVFHHPSREAVLQESMQGKPARFQFLSNNPRLHSGERCQVNVFTQGSTEKWTLGGSIAGTRFGARATRNEKGHISFRAGVAYHNVDSFEAPGMDSNGQGCKNLSSTTMFANRFNATVVEVGMKQDLRQLELVIVDTLTNVIRTGYGSFELPEILIRGYFSGILDSHDDSGGPLGTFVSRQVDIRKGQQQVAELSMLAIIGVIVTLVGTVLLLAVAIFVHPRVRLSSTSYISQLHREQQLENGWGIEPGDKDRGEDLATA